MGKPVIKGDTITVPSNQDFLADVDLFLEATLRGFGADESVVADIAISVSELVNNAILHGNQSIDSKTVTVRIIHETTSVTITVTDQGTGFNPEEIADPLADENLLQEVGRGLFIVRSLMDEIDVRPTPQGTTIAITKAI
jgi:serine/threonine-protein kinase RsbW